MRVRILEYLDKQAKAKENNLLKMSSIELAGYYINNYPADPIHKFSRDISEGKLVSSVKCQETFTLMKALLGVKGRCKNVRNK